MSNHEDRNYWKQHSQILLFSLILWLLTAFGAYSLGFITGFTFQLFPQTKVLKQ